MKGFDFKILFPALAIALLACDPTAAFRMIPGNYVGYLEARENGVETDSTVSASIQAAGPRGLKASITAGESLANLEVSFDQKDVTLTWDGFTNQEKLTRSSKDCFSGSGSNRLCFNGQEITVFVSNGSSMRKLVLERAQAQSDSALEAPRAFSLDDVLKTAATQNFETQEEFQRVLRARYEKDLQEANLIPSFNANAALNVFSYNPLNIAKVTANLAPFLLPDRWFHARGARFASQAEQDAFLAMKADVTLLAEVLTYSIARDTDAIRVLDDDSAKVAAVQKDLREYEGTAQEQSGSNAEIGSVVVSLKSTEIQFEQERNAERFALAHVLGYNNPEIVSTVVVPEDLSIEANAPQFNESETISLAKDRSPELREMDALISASRALTKGRIFNWIDPSGDQEGSLGFGTRDYIEVQEARTGELLAKRNDAANDFGARAATAINEYETAVEVYRNAVEGMQNENVTVSRLRTNLKIGYPFSLQELATSLKNLAIDDLNRVLALYDSDMAISKIERLTLSGPYTGYTASELK